MQMMSAVGQKVLRIKLRQREAVYNMKESVLSKMTYPLPPFSTVMGALHVACGYREYHPLEISVQGCFRSMRRKTYRAIVPMEKVQNDRAVLYYTDIPGCLGTGSAKVATADAQNADISTGVKTTVFDRGLHRKYADAYVGGGTKNLDPRFVSVVVGPRCYEVLYDIELVLHVRAAEDTIADIKKNITNFVSLGRREDFVDIESCEETVLQPPNDEATRLLPPKYYSGWLNPVFIKKEILSVPESNKFGATGTLFCLPKNYVIEKPKGKKQGVGKRIFENKWAVWASRYIFDEDWEDCFDGLPDETKASLLVDYIDDENGYIVNFF